MSTILTNGIVSVNSFTGIHIKLVENRGIVTIRFSDIKLNNCGYNDLLTATGIFIKSSAGIITKREVLLGAVNPEIPLDITTDVIRTYICNYGPNNLWIRYKFKLEEGG